MSHPYTPVGTQTPTKPDLDSHVTILAQQYQLTSAHPEPRTKGIHSTESMIPTKSTQRGLPPTSPVHDLAQSKATIDDIFAKSKIALYENSVQLNTNPLANLV